MMWQEPQCSLKSTLPSGASPSLEVMCATAPQPEATNDTVTARIAIGARRRFEAFGADERGDGGMVGELPG